MRIEFDTTKYAYEYGHTPRGYGFWGFAFEGYEFWAKGTYTEAKRACVADVRQKAPAGYAGTVRVDVLT